jgi:hypothetical protein
MLCVEKQRRIWRCSECNIGTDVNNLFLFLQREREYLGFKMMAGEEHTEVAK